MAEGSNFDYLFKVRGLWVLGATGRADVVVAGFRSSSLETLVSGNRALFVFLILVVCILTVEVFVCIVIVRSV